MCLALWASGLILRYTTLQYLIPSFPWIAPPHPPPWRNPRKERDQILPSGNHAATDCVHIRSPICNQFGGWAWFRRPFPVSWFGLVRFIMKATKIRPSSLRNPLPWAHGLKFRPWSRSEWGGEGTESRVLKRQASLEKWMKTCITRVSRSFHRLRGSDRGKLSAGHYHMMVGDPKNVYGSSLDLHPNFTLKLDWLSPILV